MGHLASHLVTSLNLDKHILSQLIVVPLSKALDPKATWGNNEIMNRMVLKNWILQTPEEAKEVSIDRPFIDV